MVAYACEPGMGSDPGIGWNMAMRMAQDHDVTVLTRSNNRGVIESAGLESDGPHPRFVFFDLPAWARFWKRGARGANLYHYLWHVLSARTARRLHASEPFDVAHHVTLVRYWTPSSAAFLQIPFVWGPVGGGESTPPSSWRGLGLRGWLSEVFRVIARSILELDPLVRKTARRADVALAATSETRERIESIAPRTRVEVVSVAALSADDIRKIGEPVPVPENPIFVSVGRLLAWKGFHLGVRAFARAGLAGAARYQIVGDGPERARLERLAEALDVELEFLGMLSREDTLRVIAGSTALVHPSLHDSGGFVCLEAMASGRPVVCLDTGGPAVLVPDGAGYRIALGPEERMIDDLARRLGTLSSDASLAQSLGAAARLEVIARGTWNHVARAVNESYREAVSRVAEERHAL